MEGWHGCNKDGNSMSQEMRLQCIHFVHFITHHVTKMKFVTGYGLVRTGVTARDHRTLILTLARIMVYTSLDQLQGFQYDGHFCDTTLYFVSPGLDVPGVVKVVEEGV